MNWVTNLKKKKCWQQLNIFFTEKKKFDPTIKRRYTPGEYKKLQASNIQKLKILRLQIIVLWVL